MSLAQQMKEAIERAVPEARATVEFLGGGHYEIDVLASSFEGKSRVQRQRMVYEAIAPWMGGDGAPVHAID